MQGKARNEQYDEVLKELQELRFKQNMLEVKRNLQELLEILKNPILSSDLKARIERKIDSLMGDLEKYKVAEIDQNLLQPVEGGAAARFLAAISAGQQALTMNRQMLELAKLLHEGLGSLLEDLRGVKNPGSSSDPNDLDAKIEVLSQQEEALESLISRLSSPREDQKQIEKENLRAQQGTLETGVPKASPERRVHAQRAPATPQSAQRRSREDSLGFKELELSPERLEKEAEGLIAKSSRAEDFPQSSSIISPALSQKIIDEQISQQAVITPAPSTKQKPIRSDSQSSSSFVDEDISETDSLSRRRRGNSSDELASQVLPDPASVSAPPVQPSVSQAPEDDDFYRKLAEEIKGEKIVRDKSAEPKQKHFRRQIKAVLPILERKKPEIKAEIERIENEESQSSSAPQKKEKLEKRLKTLEKIQGMLISLKSLSRNKHRYADSYLAGRLQGVLSEVPPNNPGKTPLGEALNDMLKNNVYNPAKGTKSVSFDASIPKLDFDPKKTKKIKQLKIEHETQGQNVVVKGTFYYDRKKLFGESVFDRFRGKAPKGDSYKQFRKQIRDFVNIAIHEYGKGTSRQNPIVIVFNGAKQPEAALALLMEYKKRAHEENRTYYALHNGEEIEIKPNRILSQEEIEYFMDYANQKPEIANKDGKRKTMSKCAGYDLLENENIPLDEKKKGEEITGADLQSLFDKELGKEESKAQRQSGIQREPSQAQADSEPMETVLRVISSSPPAPKPN